MEHWIIACNQFATLNEGVHFDVRIGEIEIDVVYVKRAKTEIRMAVQHSEMLVECMAFSYQGKLQCRTFQEYSSFHEPQYCDVDDTES